MSSSGASVNIESKRMSEVIILGISGMRQASVGQVLLVYAQKRPLKMLRLNLNLKYQSQKKSGEHPSNLAPISRGATSRRNAIAFRLTTEQRAEE